MCDIEAVASLLRQQHEPIARLIERLRIQIVNQTLAECGGNYSDAARQLQLPRRTVRRSISPT